MSAVTEVYWDDAWLRAAVDAARREALAVSAAFARSRAPWRHVASSISPAPDGVRVASPDAALAEGGSRPHTIEPSRKVARFKDGTFATGPISHPGFKGTPFMRETAEAWPETVTGTLRRAIPG